MERSSQARSRSASPPRPPRRPTCFHSSTRRTTCTPLCRSQVPSSNPSSGPGGSWTRTSASSTAPCGGDRPSMKLELDCLADRKPTERPRPAGRANREPARRRLGRDDDDRPAGPADLRKQDAAIERVEPMASPPPAEAGEAGREQCKAAGRLSSRGSAERRESRRTQHDRVQPTEIREREPDGEREGKQVSGCGPRRSGGITSPRRFSMRAGPNPGIASRSSTEVNGPCSVPVVHDLLRRDRPDARKRVELLDRRGVEVDRAPTGDPAPPAAGATVPPGPARARAPAPRRRAAPRG